jgi:hypothetical protein
MQFIVHASSDSRCNLLSNQDTKINNICNHLRPYTKAATIAEASTLIRLWQLLLHPESAALRLS